MLDLTPGERRGALIVLALCLLGALWDLAHERPQPTPPAPAFDSGAGGGVPAVAGAARGPATASGPVDLGTADAAGLDALPGIGPVLAARIVAHRARHGAFRSVDE